MQDSVARCATLEMIFGQSSNSAAAQWKCTVKHKDYSQCLSDFKDAFSKTEKETFTSDRKWIPNWSKNLTKVLVTIYVPYIPKWCTALLSIWNLME